jgi:DnaJ-class molecular chaperone
MSDLDYYQILGLASTATQEEIKKRFKRLSQQMHPDKGGSEEAYRDVKKAYDVLHDPQRRVIYDQGLRQGINPQEFKLVLGQVIIATLPKILGRITAHGGVFNQAAQFELATQKSNVISEQNQIKSAQKIILKHLASIKKGQQTFFAQALQKEAEKIQAALISVDITLAVLQFLADDTTNMTCELEEATPPQLQWFNIRHTQGFTTGSTS